MSARNRERSISSLLKRPALEKVFSNLGKVKILNVLTIHGELNITAIGNKTAINHARVKVYLKELKELRIITEKRFGRIKIFKIDSTQPAGEIIFGFFRKWNSEI